MGALAKSRRRGYLWRMRWVIAVLSVVILGVGGAVAALAAEHPAPPAAPVVVSTTAPPPTTARSSPSTTAPEPAGYRPRLMEIPNVIGKDPDFAQALLHQAGFQTTVETDGQRGGYKDSRCWVQFENRHPGPVDTPQSDLGVVGYGSTIPLVVFCN